MTRYIAAGLSVYVLTLFLGCASIYKEKTVVKNINYENESVSTVTEEIPIPPIQLVEGSDQYYVKKYIDQFPSAEFKQKELMLPALVIYFDFLYLINLFQSEINSRPVSFFTSLKTPTVLYQRLYRKNGGFLLYAIDFSDYDPNLDSYGLFGLKTIKTSLNDGSYTHFVRNFDPSTTDKINNGVYQFDTSKFQLLDYPNIVIFPLKDPESFKSAGKYIYKLAQYSRKYSGTH